MWTRELKPGFWRNECLGGLPRDVRLLAVGLPGLADREGRIENRPGKIKGELFPFDADITGADVEAWLVLLEGIDFIRRYSVDGVGVIAITNFRKHQHIHPKERPSALPGVPENSRELPGEPGKGAPFRAALSALSSLSSQKLIRPLASANDPAIEPQKSAVQGNKPDGDSNGKPKLAKPSPDEVVALWHQLMPELPAVRKLTSARASSIRSRIREGDLQSLDSWRRYFEHIRTNAFLMGKVQPSNGHSRRFRPSLFWFCKPDNFAKVSEGFFDA
jgi:hypothetical protein